MEVEWADPPDADALDSVGGGGEPASDPPLLALSDICVDMLTSRFSLAARAFPSLVRYDIRLAPEPS